ncbi:hypothetical protein LTR50_006608 [Elasticomyces elasticus]|nr:hypothetical protein LTR50_006608 [Elasticomyces elasticus]
MPTTRAMARKGTTPTEEQENQPLLLKKPVRRTNSKVKDKQPVRTEKEPVKRGKGPVKSAKEPVDVARKPVQTRKKILDSANESLKITERSTRRGNKIAENAEDVIRAQRKPLSPIKSPPTAKSSQTNESDDELCGPKTPMRRYSPMKRRLEIFSETNAKPLTSPNSVIEARDRTPPPEDAWDASPKQTPPDIVQRRTTFASPALAAKHFLQTTPARLESPAKMDLAVFVQEEGPAQELSSEPIEATACMEDTSEIVVDLPAHVDLSTGDALSSLGVETIPVGACTFVNTPNWQTSSSEHPAFSLPHEPLLHDQSEQETRCMPLEDFIAFPDVECSGPTPLEIQNTSLTHVNSPASPRVNDEDFDKTSSAASTAHATQLTPAQSDHLEISTPLISPAVAGIPTSDTVTTRAQSAHGRKSDTTKPQDASGLNSQAEDTPVRQNRATGALVQAFGASCAHGETTRRASLRSAHFRIRSAVALQRHTLRVHTGTILFFIHFHGA